MVHVILNGGLGNQMFQLATGFALSRKLNTELIIDLSFFHQHENKTWNRPYELDIFNHDCNIQKNNLLNRYLTSLIPFLKKKKVGQKILKQLRYYCPDEFNYNEFNSLKNGTTLFGYFTNEHYFKQYREEILTKFTFKYPVPTECQEVFNEITKENSVSVHIRRGDYLNSKNTTIYASYPIEWYQEAIQMIKKEVSSPFFFFFSDDIDWVKNNFVDIENSTFIDINKGGNSYNDLRLMSRCKHNIITNSTFSWWGAWLNQNEHKIVIAPKYYYKDKNRPNFMPATWVLL